jgi:hypothetical protein
MSHGRSVKFQKPFLILLDNKELFSFIGRMYTTLQLPHFRGACLSFDHSFIFRFYFLY